MNRSRILEDYLKKHSIPDILVRRINAHSYLTENFAYSALRIGNSIGDYLDISIDLIFLEETAKLFGLVVNTTEHAELHTTGITENDLDTLFRAAAFFENIKLNKKRYRESLAAIKEFIRAEFRAITKK